MYFELEGFFIRIIFWIDKYFLYKFDYRREMKYVIKKTKTCTHTLYLYNFKNICIILITSILALLSDIVKIALITFKIIYSKYCDI